LLGPVEAARPRRARRRGATTESVETAARVVAEFGLDGRTSARALAERFVDGSSVDGAAEGAELRTYGHILVDEAQDLTAMEWRMLARRSPSGSMTLVGDFGQASRPGAAGNWDDVVAQVARRGRARVVTLDVNYRTPAEVMAVANRVLAVASPGIEPARAVRATGEHPRFIAVGRDDGDMELVRAAGAAARDGVARQGTTAVIAPPGLHAAITRALADVGAVANRAEAIDAPVAVLGPLDAKGLEFDHVVVVEPARLATTDPAGLRLLYVTLTRATRDLTVVHSAALPEALQDHGRAVGAAVGR
jgi:DNA helicase IV